MPELPEVEAARRALSPVMQGARFDVVQARRPDLRYPLPLRFESRLQGTVVQVVERRAKYLLVRLSSDECLLMHLGMSGSFRIQTPSETAAGQERDAEAHATGAHDHVVFQMSSGATITFNDPRRFGSMELLTAAELRTHRALSILGPEPLDAGFDASVLAVACAGKRTSLKAALLDQRVLAGIGNIYACEALHRARLSPRRRAAVLASRRGVPTRAARMLIVAIRDVLGDAIARGDKWRQANPAALLDISYFPHRFRVYDREGQPCLRRTCAGTVRRLVQAGRSTFYCPVCQR